MTITRVLTFPAADFKPPLLSLANPPYRPYSCTPFKGFSDLRMVEYDHAVRTFTVKDSYSPLPKQGLTRRVDQVFGVLGLVLLARIHR